jgi:hypothetical protein
VKRAAEAKKLFQIKALATDNLPQGNFLANAR